MGAKKIINRIVRVLLLIVVTIALLLYLAGIVLNIAGFGELRRSDSVIMEILKSGAGERAFMDTVRTDQGMITYAGVRSDITSDSVAVIFVHGSPGSLDAYTGYLANAHLQAHASLYSYDRTGFGSSHPNLARQSLSEQSSDLHHLVKKIGAKNYVLVGHSLGCSIIGKYAIDYPDDAKGLVMVSAPLDPDKEPSSWWRPLLNLPMISISIPRALRASNDELAPLKKDLEECRSHWSEIRCLVTLIHGEEDKLVPVENVAFGKRAFVHATDIRTLIIQEKGHFILWTHEELVVDEIVQMCGDKVD